MTRYLPLALALCAGTAAAETQATEEPANDEVRAIVAEMLADAQTRSSLLGRHDGKAFMLGSEDGAFRLNIGGYTQFRYIFNNREDDLDDDTEQGFQTARTRVVFSGTVHDRFDFVIRQAAGSNGDFGTLDIWARTKLGDKESPWSVQWGQMKLPFWREWIIAESKNFPVERSNLTPIFSSLYAQGAQLNYRGENIDWKLNISDGLQTAGTDFVNPAEADYAVTTRVEWLAFGNWKQFGDTTSLGNEEEGLMIGAAFHHQGETDAFGGTALDHLTQYTVDINYEATDWNIMAAYVGRHYEDANLDESFNDWGLLVQGGLFVDEKLEVFGRYDLLVPDDDAVNDDNFNTVTVGFNYYFYGHAAKFTADVLWYLDDTAGTDLLNFGQNTGTALLNSGEDDQFSLRLQFQLVF